MNEVDGSKHTMDGSKPATDYARCLVSSQVLNAENCKNAWGISELTSKRTLENLPGSMPHIHCPNIIKVFQKKCAV